MKFISILLTIFCKALFKFICEHGSTLAITYITIICGVIFLLLFAFLIELCIEPLPIRFPASAIGMIILYIILIITHRFSPNHAFRLINASLSPAADWTIGNMGVFFTPSFILIPMRPPISAREIGLLCSIFLPAFLITWIGTVLLCKLIIFLTKQDQNENLFTTNVQESNLEKNVSDEANGICIDVMTLSQAPDHQANRNHISPQDYISQSHVSHISSGSTLLNHSNRDPNYFDPEKRAVDPGSAKSIKTTQTDLDFSSAEEKLIIKLKLWFNEFIYFSLFLIGLPLYFSPGGNPQSLPLFLSTLSLSWLFSRKVIPKLWQTVLHPILVTSTITVFFIWVLGKLKGIGLVESLSHFTSGTTYLVILRHSRDVVIDPPPGAGDVLKSILVAGIISLAFPLFKYHQGLYDNIFKIILITLPNCVVSLLLWPYISHQIGIAPDRALSFSGRFLSTPFGIQILSNLHGDQSLVVVLICFTGILAILTKDLLFSLLCVRTNPGSDDAFTIGATLGVIGGAIGTATMMDSHPQAAAIATVTFVLYGVAMLSLVAIPQVANYVGFLAGLGL